MPRPLVAIVGPGEGASDAACRDAADVARGLASRGWVTLTGGRDSGVMRATAQAAGAAGGLVIGILPDTGTTRAAPGLTVALATGLGEARNAVIATAADAMVVCGMSGGTASEAALAIRAGKPVVLVGTDLVTETFLQSIAPDGSEPKVVRDADTAVAWLETQLGERQP